MSIVMLSNSLPQPKILSLLTLETIPNFKVKRKVDYFGSTNAQRRITLMSKMADWHGFGLQILLALGSWVILSLLFFGEIWFSKQSIWKFLNKLTSSLRLGCHEHCLYNFDIGSFVCLPENGKTILMSYSFRKQSRSWSCSIAGFITFPQIPIYWSLPPFHKHAVNTTDTSCCTKRLLSIFCSKKTPNFTKKKKKHIVSVLHFNLISRFRHGVN